MSVDQAFILGAGLGTRLRPLTDHLPKPLVPLFHRPLAAWAIDACARAGIQRFAINTHHLPDAWAQIPSDPSAEISLFHEPILLETGGGLKNISSWIDGKPLLIHNGDVFSTLPLEKLIAAHEASGRLVTLALRSEGDARHIALDPSGRTVTDIRRKLDRADGTHVFTGIYCIHPDFLARLPAGEKVSVIPAFLELAAAGELGAIVLDEGIWLDLGDRDSYLKAHTVLDLAPAIHPEAIIARGAEITNSVIGPGSIVEAGAVIRNSVVWPGSKISASADLDGCIICSGNPIEGKHRKADL
jgi:NDP-sugar pyrophosphorylase family protein